MFITTGPFTINTDHLCHVQAYGDGTAQLTFDVTTSDYNEPNWRAPAAIHLNKEHTLHFLQALQRLHQHVNADDLYHHYHPATQDPPRPTPAT